MKADNVPYQRENLDRLLLFMQDNSPHARQSAADTQELLKALREQVYREVTENHVPLSGLQSRKYHEWFRAQFQDLSYYKYVMMGQAWLYSEEGDFAANPDLDPELKLFLKNRGILLTEIFGGAKDEPTRFERVTTCVEICKLYTETVNDLVEFAENAYQTARQSSFVGRREEDYISQDLERDYEYEFYHQALGSARYKPGAEPEPLDSWLDRFLLYGRNLQKEIGANFYRLSGKTSQPYLEQLSQMLESIRRLWRGGPSQWHCFDNSAQLKVRIGKPSWPQEPFALQEEAEELVLTELELLLILVTELRREQQGLFYEYDLDDPNILNERQRLLYCLELDETLLERYKTEPEEVMEELEEELGMSELYLQLALERLCNREAWTQEDKEDLGVVQEYLYRWDHVPEHWEYEEA